MSTAEPTDAAVIDVGSNSVRLVVYRLEGRAIWSVYNEKILAGLGRSLFDTGRLSEPGVERALIALRRFRALLGEKKAEVLAVATAAVRDAKDGPEFVRTVREETGFKLRVLSGDDEARASALGVAAGFPSASGVVGDLGGGSLELVRVKNGEPGKAATFPLGPFALMRSGEFDPEAIEFKVRKRLGKASDFTTETLHAVGGAWRNIALIHMHATGYPLEIVHHYEIPAADALETARFIARQSRASLEQMGGASKKRAETLPYAAAVLAGVIEKLGVRQVVMSGYGLREGLLLETMSAKVRKQDPLIVGSAALARRPTDAEALGRALNAWVAPTFLAMEPIFGDRDPIVIAAACRLAELGARLHPDHRASLAFEQVLRAPVAGVTHPERAFLAAAIFARHTGVADPDALETLNRLLDNAGLTRAKALGAAIRLGCDLSGRNPKLLSYARLDISADSVNLSADASRADLLLGDQTRRRAQTLAGVLGRKLNITAA